MTQKPLYKYGDSVGPKRLAKLDPIHGYRLIADDGKLLTDDVHYTECVDVLVDDISLWKEVGFNNENNK